MPRLSILNFREIRPKKIIFKNTGLNLGNNLYRNVYFPRRVPTLSESEN